MQKRYALIALILSIFCLIGNLVLIVWDILEDAPYWKEVIWVFLMLAMAYTSYQSYKRPK